MAVITLTSDWRNSDYYIGAVKGKIVSGNSAVNIIDINHQITPYNTMHAAFVVRNCYKEFPEGTVHLIAVNTILTSKRALLIIEKNKQFFICSDSGFPGLLFPSEDKDVYRVKAKKIEESTFASLNFYIDIALKLFQGDIISDFADLCTDYVEQTPLLPTIDSNLINGSVVYIDSYQNAITNINSETFERVGKGSSFQIFVQSNHYIIDKISKTYNKVPTVSELLDLRVNSTIRIKFFPDKKENKLLLSGE
jgi:S-adenosylmethionine hydrolase